jgi:hypothetical protein
MGCAWAFVAGLWAIVQWLAVQWLAVQWLGARQSREVTLALLKFCEKV